LHNWLGVLRHLGAALLLMLPLLALAGDRPPSARTTGHIDLRPLVLWAWIATTICAFLDLRDTGIAHLAATVTLRGVQSTSPRTCLDLLQQQNRPYDDPTLCCWRGQVRLTIEGEPRPRVRS